MSEKIVCPICNIVVSKRSYHKHISRNRCEKQHIRKLKTLKT